MPSKKKKKAPKKVYFVMDEVSGDFNSGPHWSKQDAKDEMVEENEVVVTYVQEGGK